MNILILGLGKSGTTALLHKIAGGLPHCKAFSGGKPGKYIGDYENAVYKHTYNERKGKDFASYRDHLRRQRYDRKIWIARDPRDVAVSRMLYRWHRGYIGHRKQYLAHLQRVQEKEYDPVSIPFYEVCRYAGHQGWPLSREQVVEEEHARYRHMCDFVGGLESDWFVFNYADMVGNRFDALNRYLGFEVQAQGQVPRSHGKVVRKKSVGDWRHWFTREDIDLFRPAYLPYMQLTGCDCDDWVPSPNPRIEPEYASQYLQSLPKRVLLDSLIRYKDWAVWRLTKKLKHRAC